MLLYKIRNNDDYNVKDNYFVNSEKHAFITASNQKGKSSILISQINNLLHLPSGMYILRIYLLNKIYTYKVFKQ